MASSPEWLSPFLGLQFDQTNAPPISKEEKRVQSPEFSPSLLLQASPFSLFTHQSETTSLSFSSTLELSVISLFKILLFPSDIGSEGVVVATPLFSVQTLKTIK